MIRNVVFALLIVSLGFSAAGEWIDQGYVNYFDNVAIIHVDIPDSDPLYVQEGSGYREVSGEHFYIVKGKNTNINCDGNEVFHVYYDISNSVFYCAMGGGYAEYEESDVIITDAYDAIIDVSSESLLLYARNASSHFADLKVNYLEYLKNGSADIGLETDWSFLDEPAILASVSHLQIVFVSEGHPSAGYNHLRIPVPGEGVNFTESSERTITHEFSHVMIKRATFLSNGDVNSAFGYPIHEGETDFFASLVHQGKHGEFRQGAYREGEYVVASYAYLLGGDTFFRAALTPAEVDLHEEMDQLLGEEGKHLKMTAYFHSGKTGHIVPSNHQPDLTRLLWILAELEKQGYDWETIMLDNVEPLYRPSNQQFENMTFYERFGLNESEPLADQVPHTVQWYYFGSPIEPFDLREELENPPENLVPILQDTVPVLNSLDYESYDIRTQQVAFGLWRDMVESFNAYWNALPPEQQTWEEQLWFDKTQFAIASRYGITATAISSHLTDEEIDETHFRHHEAAGSVFDNLELDSWTLTPSHTGSLADPVESGEAVLYPAEIPWTNERIIHIGAGKNWKTVLSADDNITLNFQPSGVTISNLEIQSDGPEWTEISGCQMITEPGVYMLTQDIYGSPIDDPIYGDSLCFLASGFITEGLENVTIDCRGHTLQGTGEHFEHAIAIRNSSNAIVKGCNIVDYDYGIKLVRTHNTEVKYNYIEDVFVGVGFSEADDLQIYQNTMNNSIGGISGQLGDDGFIGYNTIYVYPGSGFGISVDFLGDDNLISHNNIENGEFGFLIDGFGSPWYEENEISYNTVDNATTGFAILRVQQAQLINNQATNCGLIGVAVRHSHDNQFNYTTTNYNAEYGIYLQNSSNNKFTASITNRNGIDGLYLDSDSSDNFIDPPISCFNARNGLTLNSSEDTIVDGLVACHNGNAGIYIENSTGTAIENSELTNNNAGISFATSADFDESTLSDNILSGNGEDIVIVEPSQTPEEIAHGFESADSWSPIAGWSSMSTNTDETTQGSASLEVNGNGFVQYESVQLDTTAISGESNTMLMDLYIGSNQPNPWWVGQIQLYAHCPSANIYNQWLSQVELTWLPRDQFTTLNFYVPQNVVNALQGDHDDFTWRIALNTNAGSGPYYLDNMRFQ